MNLRWNLEDKIERIQKQLKDSQEEAHVLDIKVMGGKSELRNEQVGSHKWTKQLNQ